MDSNSPEQARTPAKEKVVDVVAIEFETTKSGTGSFTFIHRDGRRSRPVSVGEFRLGDTAALRWGAGVGKGDFTISSLFES